jgi:ATP-binding protein involved in chromosome partitioning
MKIENKDIINVLKVFTHKDLSTNIVDAAMVSDVKIDGTSVALTLYENGLDKAQQVAISSEVSTFLQNRGLSVKSVKFTNVKPLKNPAKKNPFDDQKKLANIKHVIAVASGKGGVGKSTVSSNLAVTLAKLQYKVGLLDADIYGPSMNMMMGKLGAKPTTPDGTRIDPIESYGVKTISMGYLMDPEMAVIWRGPMLMKAVTQFLNDVNWGELDFLIIDMPPGTGDVQLSITQQVPLSGAIIVTTPQDVALMDVKRGVRMFEKVNVPVLGVVENMSYHICTSCGHKEHIFGSDKVQKMVTDLKTKIIAQFPLDAAIVSAGDTGRPIVLSDKNSTHTQNYLSIANKQLLPLLQ